MRPHAPRTLEDDLCQHVSCQAEKPNVRRRIRHHMPPDNGGDVTAKRSAIGRPACRLHAKAIDKRGSVDILQELGQMFSLAIQRGKLRRQIVHQVALLLDPPFRGGQLGE